VLAECLELHSLALHVGGQLHTAQGIGLADLVQVARVLLATDLLAAFASVDVIANPPDLGTGVFLEYAALLLRTPPGHVPAPPNPN
jgi:hypothetical protein